MIYIVVTIFKTSLPKRELLFCYHSAAVGLHGKGVSGFHFSITLLWLEEN